MVFNLWIKTVTDREGEFTATITMPPLGMTRSWVELTDSVISHLRAVLTAINPETEIDHVVIGEAIGGREHCLSFWSITNCWNTRPTLVSVAKLLVSNGSPTVIQLWAVEDFHEVVQWYRPLDEEVMGRIVRSDRLPIRLIALDSLGFLADGKFRVYFLSRDSFLTRAEDPDPAAWVEWKPRMMELRNVFQEEILPRFRG